MNTPEPAVEYNGEWWLVDADLPVSMAHRERVLTGVLQELGIEPRSAGPSAHTPEPAPMRLRAIWGPLRATCRRARTATNAFAHRFGYVHEDEAGGW